MRQRRIVDVRQAVPEIGSGRVGELLRRLLQGPGRRAGESLRVAPGQVLDVGHGVCLVGRKLLNQPACHRQRILLQRLACDSVRLAYEILVGLLKGGVGGLGLGDCGGIRPAAARWLAHTKKSLRTEIGPEARIVVGCVILDYPCREGRLT